MLNSKIQIAYLFDIDGVLTNPESKKIEKLELLDELNNRLEDGHLIGFNTGRSIDFIIEQVLIPLEKKIVSKNLLYKVFAIGEKGGEWITYDKYSEKVIRIDRSISVPQKIHTEVKNLMSKSPYSDIMFYCDTKHTMLATELRHGKTISEFKNLQKLLVVELQKLLDKNSLQKKFKIDATIIATDVESVRVGKGYGVRKFLELLEIKNLNPDMFIAFGDSISDYAMLEEFQFLNKKAKFVFVGEKKSLDNKSTSGVIFTKHLTDIGTLEFLQNE